MLQSLAEKDRSELDILVVYIDGIQFGKYHVICAMGVDSGGHKHVLSLREGATANAEVATALLEDLVGRGLDAFARRLFVIDGSKALRKAIDQVFGAKTGAVRYGTESSRTDPQPKISESLKSLPCNEKRPHAETCDRQIWTILDSNQ
jgi:putative transposase